MTDEELRNRFDALRIQGTKTNKKRTEADLKARFDYLQAQGSQQPAQPVATQPVAESAPQVVTQPVQSAQQPIRTHGQVAQQGLQQAQDKLHAAEQKSTPMTDKLNAGGTLTPEEVIQLAREQGRISDNEAKYRLELENAKKKPIANTYANPENFEKAKPTTTVAKKQGEKEAKEELATINNDNIATKYLETKDKLATAKATKDTRQIAKNETILKGIKQGYNAEKRDVDVVQSRKDYEAWGETVAHDLANYNNATTPEQKQIFAQTFLRDKEAYDQAYRQYAEDLTYDEIKNNNIAKDSASSFGKNVLGGTANIINGAYTAGTRLAGLDATSINADSLLKFNNGEQFNATDVTNFIASGLNPITGIVNNVTGLGEGPTSSFAKLTQLRVLNPYNKRLENLYNQIANKTYNGTKQQLANELDAIQKEIYQNFKDVYTQDELDAVADQLRHNEVYGDYAAIPNAFGTTGNMVPSILIGTATGGLGEALGGSSMATAGTIANTAQQVGSMGSLGLGAYSQGMDEALQNGASYNQAQLYGALSGATEVGTEMLGGETVNRFLGQTGKSALGKVFGKAIDNLNIESKVGRIVANTLSDVAGESTEEMISEALNPLWKAITYDPNALPQNEAELGEYFKNILKAGADAIPSTLLMQGAGVAGNVVKTQQVENGIIKSINESDLSQIVKNQLINEVRKASTDVKLGLEEAQYMQDKAYEKGFNLAAQSEQMKQRIPEGYSLPQSTIDILAYTENNRPGLNIAFDTNIQGNGTFVENPDGTRTITLNPNSKRAVEFTLTHELGHDLKGTGEYTQLQNLLTDYAKGKPGYQEALKQLDKTYRESGANYNLQDEATNDMLGQAIGEQEFYNKLAENPTLFNRVTNGLKNLLGNKDTKLKNKIEKLTSNALKQEYQGEQQGAQQSLSDTENDKTLAATHNLTEEKLRGILELGGFPVPSIAVSDVNKLTPTQFGDITVLFDKDTIDPADKRNEVYDRDVWSPTFPSSEYDVSNEDIIKNVTNGYLTKEDLNDSIISDIVPRYLYADNLKGFLNTGGIQDTLNRIKDDKSMQYFYLKKHKDFQPVMTQADFSNSSDYGNAELQRFNEEYTGKPLSELSHDEIMSLGNKVADIILKSHENDINAMLQNTEYGDGFKQNFIKYYEDIANQYKDNFGKLDQFLYSAENMKNTDTQVVDKEATLNKVKDAINKEEYDKWVDTTFGEIFRNAKRGIRNDKDTFTPTGNRRSFSQLHDDYNIDNIVKHMTKGQTKAGEGAIFGGGFGDVQAMAADRFNSIEDIRNAKNRLTTSQEANQLLAPTKEEIKDRIEELSKYSKNDGNWFGIGMGAFDRANDAITEFAGRKKLTVDEFKKILKKYPTFDVNAIPNDVLQNTVDSVKKLKQIYTDYFEAKPQRAVGFEEIASVLIPNTLAEDTKQQLRDRGINYVEYDPNVEGDREAKYREAAQDVLFSKQNNTWQQFLDNTYGKWNTGTRTNFEGLPSNEELQQAERDSVANEPIALYSLSEEQQNEVNDYISKLNNDTTIDDNFKDQILTRFDNLTDYKQFENIKQDVEDYKEKAYQGIKSLVDVANMSEDNVRQRPMEYTQRKDKNTPNQRRFFDNAETSNIIADETKSRYNATTYEQKANLDTLEQVRQKLDERGNDMIEEWKHKTKNFTDKDVALGAILIERYQQQGDWNSAARAVEKLADMGTEAGRAVQMYSIFQRLSPETMAIYQQKALDKAFEEMKQRKTGKWVEANKDKFKLTAEDTQFIYEQVEKASQAIDEETKQRELSKIENRINEKLPPNSGDAIKTLRRIAMLFNPKTQVRNITGNTLIMPVNDVADIVGTAIDKLISRRTGTRTTGLPNPITKIKGFAKGVKSAVTDYKTGTRTTGSGSKYEFEIGAKPFNENTDSKVRNAINHKLNGINDLLSAVMSGGDRPFYEAAYKNSLEAQMKANKVKEPTADMIDIAVNEALQRTWNDNNEYTKAVLGIRNVMNRINIKGFGLGDLIIPFAKTPANLTKAIVEYSPVGFIPAISNYVDMNRAISRGEMTAQQQKKFVSSMSKAVAGTILYTIAGSLVRAGKITGSADDDKDVRNFEQNVLGIQPYSVRLGDKTYTYSWANPINAPLAIMADTYKMSKENASLYDTLFNAVKVAGNVLLDNSFLQGISDIFTHQEGPVAGVVESIMSMPESMIPTFMSQIASLGDDTQRQTYEYKNKGQSVINRIKNKIPGARQTLEPQVNTFGEEIENQNNAFNAFLNPANVKEARTTEAQKEIYSLYEATGDKTIFPMQAPNSVVKNGETTNLTNQQKVRYQKGSGQYATEVYEPLFDTNYYDSISNSKRTELLQRVSQDANKMGKTMVGVWTEDTFKVHERYNNLADEGIPLVDYYIAWQAQKDITSDKDANGKTIQLSASKKKKEAIDNAVEGLNQNQMETLYGMFDISEKVW